MGLPPSKKPPPEAEHLTLIKLFQTKFQERHTNIILKHRNNKLYLLSIQ